MVLEQIIFIVLAVVATLSAIGMVAMKDPVHSALMLVFTFFNLAGIYILMGAEFLAAIQVLVYAGAIVVLFLFVMMLLQVRPGPSFNKLRFFQSRLGPVLALVFLVEVVAVIFGSSFLLNGGKITDANNRQAAQVAASVKYVSETRIPNQDAQGNTTGGTGIGLADVRGPNGERLSPTTGGHPALLGKELYSTYLFPFEVASLILLIAAIGAIVIARRSIEHDAGEGGPSRIGRGISLTSALPDSPQYVEGIKRDEELAATAKTSRDARLAAAAERKLTMRK